LFSLTKKRSSSSLDFLNKLPIMVKIMKNQKVVIVLAGRYAGRKAVIVKVILSSIEFNSNFKFLAT
jgi:hypothetical protein